MLKHYFLFSLLAISMAFYACQDNAGATGQTDASKDTEDIAQFVEDENFKNLASEANKSVKIKSYDADHAFANPSSPRYNEQAARDANQAALEFLKANL